MTNGQRAALLLLFLLATAVRIDALNRLPLTFHPARQYSSALQARDLFFQTQDVPEWQRQVTRRAVGKPLEPPFLQTLAVAGYHMAGGERLWIPQLFSALFWLCGGGFVFAVARTLGGFVPAFAATAFYLLLPFSVPASRSFQPNPLMVLLTLITVWCLVQYRVSGAASTLLGAAGAAALAILVMPVSAPVIIGSFAALEIQQHGRAALTRPAFALFLSGALLPAAAYYGHGIWRGGMAWKVSSSFVPAYFLEPRFWDGTLKRIRLVLGFSFPLLGILGVLFSAPGPGRALLVGLWTGYVGMCLAFNYHVSTHDYYHLLLIPIVALSLVPLLEVLVRRLEEAADRSFLRPASRALLAVACLLAAGTAFQARRRPPAADTIAVTTAIEIGRAVGHSTQAIVLDPTGGAALLYHGLFSGIRWPHLYDIRDEAMWGQAPIPARERLARYARELGGAGYFVVTDLPELDRQADLKQILQREARLTASGEGYAVFDLSALAGIARR